MRRGGEFDSGQLRGQAIEAKLPRTGRATRLRGRFGAWCARPSDRRAAPLARRPPTARFPISVQAPTI